MGYITPAVQGVNKASEHANTLQVAHDGADWLHNRCHLQGPERYKAGDKVETGPEMGGWATQSIHLWPTGEVVPRLQASGNPPNVSDYVPNMRTCGPPFMLSPVVNCCGPPKLQGLGRQIAHLWVTYAILPHSKARGASIEQGLCSPSAPFRSTSDLSPYLEA